MASEAEPFLDEPQHHSPPQYCQIRRTWKTSSVSGLWSLLSAPIFSHCLVFIATSLLWGGILLLHTHASTLENTGGIHEMISKARWQGCGSSTEEAKMAGCQYDILSNHWVPKACADQVSVEEYQTDGSWFGYGDRNRTELLTIDAMGDRPVYYTSVRDHIVHCAMLWRKQYRAFFDGRRNLDNIIVDTKHTMHCSEYLINMTDYGTDFWNVPIAVEVGWAGCYTMD